MGYTAGYRTAHAQYTREAGMTATTHVRLPMRQVHLDFHTAPEITDSGLAWDAEAFSTRHRSMSDRPAAAGQVHPALTFYPTLWRAIAAT